jgi:uncharacterized protein
VPDREDCIDCDVRIRPPSVSQLQPYLSAQWRDFFAEIRFSRPREIGHSFPAWAYAAAENESGLLGACSNAVLSCYYAVETVRHPFMASALAAGINAWMQAEWLDRDERLYGSITIPAQDTESAVAQIDRFATDRRFVQVVVPSRSWEPYGNRRYWPIWRAAAEHGLPVTIQYGGLAGSPPTPVGRFRSFFEDYAAATQLFQAQLTSFVSEGVLDELPMLRVCLLESGVTWLPSLMWKMDTEWLALRREIPWVRRPPSEYVREHVRLTLGPLDAPDSDRELAEVLSQIHSDQMLMYGRDYPGQGSSSLERLSTILQPDQLRAVMWGNAFEFYALSNRQPNPTRIQGERL